MNLWLPIGDDMEIAALNLSQHLGIHNQIYLGELSHVINLPDATTSVFANYINSQLIEYGLV